MGARVFRLEEWKWTVERNGTTAHRLAVPGKKSPEVGMVLISQEFWRSCT